MLSGQTAAHTQPPTSFPLVTPGVSHTYASYHQQPVAVVNQGDFGWRLCLNIPIPSKCLAPTLTSLVYILKYATTHDGGDSTVQTDTILTTASCPNGVTNHATSLSVYHSASNCGYGPHITDNEAAMCLSTVPAVKHNSCNASWSHYIDHHRVIPNASPNLVTCT